ncbi:M50 family metallopeptidase [Ornithinimicrobium sp. Y1847]|uniref:M50 family metallopeptidase n=1 Tax=unclassified Ornithinimicrobium TaxID=2615080 RepID=UPI003B67A9A3
MLADLLDRLTTTQPPLEWQVALVLGVMALVLSWSVRGHRLTRHLITLVHEAGHALVAVLVGRRLSAIRLHSDTSGLTVSRGRPSGPGMVAMLAIGYPAPALVGLLGAVVLGLGYAAALLWGLVLLCALMLLLVRNLYGLWVLLVTGVGLGALSWVGTPAILSGTAYLVVWVLLLGAPRAVAELQRERRRRRDRTSDADQLARLTGIPALTWVVVFWVVCAAALVVGGLLTLGITVIDWWPW